MRIVISGAGIVGSSLAEHLLADGHTVSVVDPDRSVCAQLRDTLDLMVICGTGASPTILDEAGLRGADMAIAVTPNDATNILVCGIARQFGVGRRIARIRSAEYTRRDLVDLAALGVTDVIDPERVVVDSIRDRLGSPGALETMRFRGGSMLLRAYRLGPDAPIAGRTLVETRRMAEPHVILTVAVTRDGMTTIPHGDFRLGVDDRIVALLEDGALPTLQKLVGRPGGLDERKIILSGETLTARHLAAELEAGAGRVILVDPDLDHGRQSADALLRTEVLHGDLTDPDLMLELNIERADAFVGASSETEHNLMACLLARNVGIPQVICVSHERRHDSLIESLGVAQVVNPRLKIARAILETIMAGQFRIAQSVQHAGLEVMRLPVAGGTPAAGAALTELWLPFRSEAIVGACVREGRMTVATGPTRLAPGDEAIVFARPGVADRIRALFEPHPGILETAKRLITGK